MASQAAITGGAQATAPVRGLSGVETAIGAVVLIGTVALVATFWADAGRAWIYPELLPIGQAGQQAGNGFGAFLAHLFDWKLFDPDAQRIRTVSDLFELIDSYTRRWLSALLIHPSLTASVVLCAVTVPALFYGALRSAMFRRGEALLACALLIASPGFLSDLFVYIRPAKPISFILLAWTIWFVLRTRTRDLGWRERAEVIALVVLGAFTDEILFWTPFFLVVARLLTRQTLRATGEMALCAIAGIAAVLVLQFYVLPPLYNWLGTDGPRTIAMIDPRRDGDTPTALRMAMVLLNPLFLVTVMGVWARGLAAHLGLTINDANTMLPFLAVLIAIAAALILSFRRHGCGATWQLGAVAAFGFISYAAFGDWLHWKQLFPNEFFDLVSFGYYYNSPVSLFAVLLLAVGLRLAVGWIGAAWRPVIAGVVVAAVVVATTTLFLSLNGFMRFVTIANTDTAALFAAMRSGLGQSDLRDRLAAPPFDEAYDAYDREGQRLFGAYWATSNFAQSRAFFANTQFYGDHTALPARYGQGVCRVFLGEECSAAFGGEPLVEPNVRTTQVDAPR